MLAPFDLPVRSMGERTSATGLGASSLARILRPAHTCIDYQLHTAADVARSREPNVRFIRGFVIGM
jgi:hypothetical protein